MFTFSVKPTFRFEKFLQRGIAVLLVAIAVPASAEQPVSPTWMLIQTLGGLALVIALIFALAFAARKLKLGPAGGDSNLRVISTISLGAREKAVLVQVGDHQLLLGVAQGQITTLKELEILRVRSVVPPMEKADSDELPSPPVTSEFSRKLSELLTRGCKN